MGSRDASNSSHDSLFPRPFPPTSHQRTPSNSIRTMDSLLGGLDQGTPVPPTPRRFVKGGLSVDPYNTSALSAPTTATSVSAPGSPDVSDYVRYLLQGTGAESNVDFTRLRRELEDLDTDTDRAAVVGDSHGDAASEFVSPATDDASIEKILRESMRDREARRGGAGAGAGAGADDSFADFFGGGSKNNEQQQYDVAQHNNNRSSLPPTDSSLPPSRPHSRTVSIPTTAAPTTNNNNRSSAAQALEAELALWRSQKSRWAADIARRRASLDEVHKLVNEPTFGGGMTMLLEGLAGLRFQQENNIGSSANKHEQYDDEELEESPVPSDLPPLPGSKTATTTVAPTPTPRPAPAVPAHHQATPARTPQITVTTDSVGCLLAQPWLRHPLLFNSNTTPPPRFSFSLVCLAATSTPRPHRPLHPPLPIRLLPPTHLPLPAPRFPTIRPPHPNPRLARLQIPRIDCAQKCTGFRGSSEGSDGS